MYWSFYFADPHSHSLVFRENANWEADQSSLNEALIALCASYTALARYISGADIYLMPRSFNELESKLFVSHVPSSSLLFLTHFTSIGGATPTTLFITPSLSQRTHSNVAAIAEYASFPSSFYVHITQPPDVYLK